MKKTKAFTLIELLVVIAIIGILATVSVIALSNARTKSRDAKRVADIKQIQTALELFFNDKNRYPTAEEFASGSIFSTSTGATSTYMQVIPSAPTPADGSCTSNQNAVYYQQTEDGSSYTISFCLGNTTGTLDPGPKCLTPAGIMSNDCSAVDILACSDSTSGGSQCTYGGQTYDTVAIGSQVWLEQNLSVGTRIDSANNQGNYSSGIEKYCYDNDDSNCAVYGGLYQWHMAMGLDQSCDTATCSGQIQTPHQGICPDGWHIPSEADWLGLINYLDPTCTTYDLNNGCPVAGVALKEDGTSHWSPSNECGGGVCNSSGFTALPSGHRDSFTPGSFTGLLIESYIWSAAEIDSTTAWDNYLYNNDQQAYWSNDNKQQGWSVRCLRD